jgi:hypothetical protein
MVKGRRSIRVGVGIVEKDARFVRWTSLIDAVELEHGSSGGADPIGGR